MRLKTLLLGSAAAFAVAGGAQAADLSVAEPVDYVRVCDAFGVGYWYIPGTDQCIAISGKVKFQTGYAKDSGTHVNFGNLGDLNPNNDLDTADWYMSTGADFNVDVRSITDWGPLVAYVAFTSDSDNSSLNSDNSNNVINLDRFVYLDEAFLSLGPLLLGYTGSVFDVAGGGYTDYDFKLSDDDVDQVQLSWSFNGFGIAIGIEDPRDRWGSDTSMNFPDISGALTANFGGVDAAVSMLYSDLEGGSFWAVEGSLEAEFGIWQFQVGAIYGDGPSGASLKYLSGNGYAAFASSQQNWASNFYTAETVAYDDPSSTWGAAFMMAYSPVDTLWLSLNAGTDDWSTSDSWQVYFLAEKTFGPNG
jgi:Porin subfamily